MSLSNIVAIAASYNHLNFCEISNAELPLLLIRKNYSKLYKVIKLVLLTYYRYRENTMLLSIEIVYFTKISIAR